MFCEDIWLLLFISLFEQNFVSFFFNDWNHENIKLKKKEKVIISNNIQL